MITNRLRALLLSFFAGISTLNAGGGGSKEDQVYGYAVLNEGGDYRSREDLADGHAMVKRSVEERIVAERIVGECEVLLQAVREKKKAVNKKDRQALLALKEEKREIKAQARPYMWVRYDVALARANLI